MRQAAQAIERNPLTRQIVDQLLGMRLEHDALAGHAMDIRQRVVAPGKQHQRRMLEDHAEYDHRLAGIAFENQAAGPDAKLGTPGYHLGHHILPGSGLPDIDGQPGLIVIAQLLRHVVTGELEAMLPFELQGHRFGGNCRLPKDGPKDEEKAQGRPKAHVGQAL